MFGNVFVSLAAAVGVAIWVYRKFATRATGGQFNKTIAPALIAGVLTFLIMITIITTAF